MVVVLGAGNPEKVIKNAKISGEELDNIVSSLGKLLAKKGCELIIVPDEGIPLEVAKAYKANGGKKLSGLVPTKDKKFGTKHIQQYLKILDKKIEVDSWYDVNGEIAAIGDICIVIGLSPGVMIELCFLKYHRKFFNNKTRVFILKNTISAPIPKEIEEELAVEYVNSVSELENLFS